MAKKVLAFDIGGTSIRAAIVKDNKIVRLLRAGTPKSKKEFVEVIFKFGDELFDKSIKGIGVGCAGVIKSGIIKTSPNLPIRDFNMKKILEKRYKVKVEVFNDAGCFSLAELKLGCKKKNFVIFTLGTGIGGGIVINGEPYRGGTGLGAEFGHTYVNGQDFESLWKRTREKIKKEFHRNVLLKELVKMNYRKADEILEESADYLGKGIASVISILDPEVVILAGGPSESGTKFINLIQKSVSKYNFLPRKVPVRWTRLKQPGILGASLLVS